MMIFGVLLIFTSMVTTRAAAPAFHLAATLAPANSFRTTEHTTVSSPHPISDHRFFLQEIFTKYGHGGQMTFEGFEHLLESLGLGNIIIHDHDVLSHKEDSFQKSHDSHDHSKKLDSDHVHKTNTNDQRHEIRPTLQPQKKKGHKDSPGLPTPTPTSTSSMGKYETVLPPTPNHLHHNRQSASQSTLHDARPTIQPSGHADSQQGRTDNIYHYHLPDMVIPELLVNISSIVDQHQELENQGPEIIIEQCLSPKEILEAFGINQTSNLNPVSFLHLCPAIIYELDQGRCMFRNQPHKLPQGAITFDQFLYSCLAVLIISLCGLLSVAVIPIMQKWFYHTLLQFLVGLAIGSLSGDALLHLMPHAMLSGEGAHGHDDTFATDSAEKNAIWRGFAALCGIFFFFIAERLLGALTVAKKRGRDAKEHKDNKRELVEVSSDEFSHGLIGKKLSHYKRNSYDFAASEKEKMHMLPSNTNVQFVYNAPPSFESSEKSQVIFGPASETAVTVMGHPSHSHGHVHGHGHSHEVPQSVSAVAWMVIMGDGLHNFCDGLAIGAAFASGIEGGISTSVAVFCHELPHELGDFAMLLRTGMKVRQALFYNGLSSILCLLGMVIGLSLGNVHSATGWVFAATAGMFIYIALVDMLPELSSTKHDPNSPSSYQLAIQVLGISIGVCIMLLIANYEQDLQTLVS